MSPRGESAEDDVISRAVVACQRGDLKELDQLLEQDGVNASSSDTDGCSLLHWAAINNRVPIVQRLLSLGADPNVLGGILQSSALHWAARVGNLASCAVLIKAGAVANVRDTQGYTPIHLAVQGQHNNLVAYLLEKFDYAANITDNSGMTPTMWSAYRSFTIFPLRLILRKMADIDAKEHLQGNTALHLAAQERNYTAVIELVEGGADVSVKNKQHETAMDIARNNRNQRIIAMLEEGARRQGLQSQSCFHRLKRFRKVGQFVLPGCVLSLAGLLFYLFHYGIASMLVLILIIVIGCTVQIDMHGSHASLIPIGITVAEPCVMIVTWSVQVHWFAPWWLQISFFCIMFVLFLSLARLYFGDPGVVAPSLTADSFVTAVESLTPRLNYCFTCWVDRADGSKHCAVCNRCVRGFDHHCPWLHNCVTKRNLRDFVIFVFCVAASSVVYSGAVIHLSATIVRDYSLDHLLMRHCFLIITALLAMFHAFALSMLFFQQCYQISSRVTTHDLIQRRRGHAPSYPTQDDVTDPTTSSTHSHSPFRMHGNVSLSERVRNIFEFCSGKY